MHIAFDNLQEFQEFVEYCGFARKTLAPAEVPGIEIHEESDEYVSVTAAEVIAERGDSMMSLAQAKDEVVKRKRRTKAEMEAARAAEAAGNTDASAETHQPAGEPHDASAIHALEPAHGANPFAASTSIAQIVQAAIQAQPEQHTTLAQVADAQRGVEADKPNDPAVATPTRAAQIGKVDAIEHMRRAREFIAAKGQQVYQRTFALAGLTSNVMSYTPEQCAQHLAAMEWLHANPDA